MNESPDKKPSTDFLGWIGFSNQPDWNKARPLGAVLGGILVLAVPLLFLGALVAAGAVLWHTIALALSGGTEGINLGAGALIAALLGAPFVIWGTVLKWQTVRYQKEGHMTDRIAKAVEQLGAEKTVKREDKEETQPNLEVRMGAILSLERIAQDSTTHDHGRDHVRVMEILCAYIRHNAPANSAKDHDLGEWPAYPENVTPAQIKERESWRRDRAQRLRDWIDSLPPVRADVQLALQVIGRRRADQRRVEAAWPDRPDSSTRWPFDPDFKRLPDEPGEEAITLEDIKAFKRGLEAWKKKCSDYPGYQLDLRRTNLQTADMAAGRPEGADAVFSGALFDGARMEGASLDGARLEGASLDKARLEGVSLDEARMEGTSLDWARMEGANLHKALMEGASIFGAQMESARLNMVRMEGASFDWAGMEGVILDRARMEGASLYGVRMENASLDRARIEDASLYDVRMENSRFDGAQMERVVFAETDLTGARGLTAKQLASTFGDGRVKLPATLPRPAHWPNANLDWYDFHSELSQWRASPSTYCPPQHR